ncbi:MAG: outer membrane beta-barrel protein [Paramuribaculum sp.]|nr:outer membrane beta-barrel protein [Paramuribaculum sp.]
MKALIRHILLAVALLMVSLPVCAQKDVESYRFDAGVGVGMSGYLGDASVNLFGHPGIAANVGMRYLFDSRWAAKAQISMATLSGNTADMDNVLPGFAEYKFNSTVYDLGITGEANFFAYGMGETYKRLRRWTPFLSLGVGVTVAATEGGGTSAAFNIPMGVGVKFKTSRRVNLHVQFTMTKVFGDHVDSSELSDLYQIKSSFFKNTDWYSQLTFGFSYEFGPRCVTCNRID